MVFQRILKPSLLGRFKTGFRHGSSSSGHNPNYPYGMYWEVNPWHKRFGTGFCTIMWLWIFHRARNDGAALLGLEHPWEHGHGHGHGDSHGEEKIRSGPYVYETEEIGERPRLV